MSDPIPEAGLRAEVRLLLRGRLKSPEDVLAEELVMPDGRARIDIALFNGHIEAFELKSDFDTLKRLQHQRDNLAHYFDRLTLVSTKKHFDRATNMLPEWWGLILAEKAPTGIRLRRMRGPKLNAERVVEKQLSLLWREDLVELARKFKKGPEKLADQSKPQLCRVLAAASPGPGFMRAVRALLKDRVRSKLALR